LRRKALDDRVGSVVLLETLHRTKDEGIHTPNTICFVGTVQVPGQLDARKVAEIEGL